MRKITAIATIVFLATFYLDNLGCFRWITDIETAAAALPGGEPAAKHPALASLYHAYYVGLSLLVLLLNVICLFGRGRPAESADPPAGMISAAKIVGGVGLCALFSLLVALGGDEFSFIDIPSFIAVVGFTYFALLLSYGGRTHGFVRHSAQAFFRQGVQPSPEFCGMAKWGGIYALVSGLLMWLLGCMQMLGNISCWNPDSFSRGFSVALIPALLGGLFNLFVFMPLARLWAGRESCR